MPPIRTSTPFGASAIVTAIITVMLTLAPAAGGHVAAHDGIASSDPVSGSVVDDPIESVMIDFGADIGSTAQMALIGPDGTQIPSTTTVTSTTTAVTAFDAIDDEGTYTVNYIATSIIDGHVLGGSITFTFGDTSADTMSPIVFGAIALVILGIGGWFSWRARRRHHEEAAPAAGEHA